MYVLTSVCTLAAGLAAAAAVRDEAAIQQWLDQHARRTQSVEVPAARLRVVGDLDGDGRSDVAVLYTLRSRAARGGESRYLAAFRRQREAAQHAHPDALRYHAHVLVSGPGAGEANRITILKQAVVVEMLTFAPGDAPCCPTRPTRRRYHMAGQGLVLAAADTARHPR